VPRSKRKKFKLRDFLFYLLIFLSGFLFFLFINNGRLPTVSDLKYLLGLESFEGLLGPVELVRVSDGDTIVVTLDGEEESIRLIGIDTPEKYQSDKLERDDANSPLSKEELQRLGKKASEVTENLVEGKWLFLELDAEERDRYRRLLAYVYFKDNQGEYSFENENFKQVNLEIVKAGWAQPLTIPPNVRYADDYVAASKLARAEDKGMWAEIP
jgi:micrococcal nuclease